LFNGITDIILKSRYGLPLYPFAGREAEGSPAGKETPKKEKWGQDHQTK
jgi:hypothetical protein